MCDKVRIDLTRPNDYRHWLLAAMGAVLWLCSSVELRAGTFEAGGLSFSDELGGFRLLSASGLGTISDPIVLVEEVTNLNPAVLTVRQADVEGTQSTATRILMRSLIKVVINKSAWRWTGFDLELRGDGGQASVYTDGLSFDQVRAIPTPVRSDSFASIRTEDEPYDRVRYDQGRVDPGETVQLAFNLIDLNPRSLFYLAQEPIVLLTDRMENRRNYAGFIPPRSRAAKRSLSMPKSP